MKISVFVSIVFCFGSPAWMNPAIAQTHVLPDRVYRGAQERVDAGYFDALVIAYVDGDTSEVDAFGNSDGNNAADGDTVFEIGSITKTFTATLLANGVQRGAVKLDAPLATLLPDFTIPARNGKQITLLDIATQTSALPRLPGNLKPADEKDPYADYGAAQLKAFLSSYSLTRDPGATYEYSNLGFGLLGFALAQHAHTTYRDLIRRDLFQALGMTLSDVITTPAMRRHLAVGHDDAGKAVPEWTFDALAGAGAIRSTGNDMLRYLKANMGVSKTPLLHAMKFAQEPRRDIGNATRIGLAWMTKAEKPHDVVWHNGKTAGYTSFLGFTDDGKRGVVILTNSSSSLEPLGFAALLDDAPLTEVDHHKRVAMDAASLRDYIGVYRLSDVMLLTIVAQDNQLFGIATGQGPFAIFPSAKNEFFAHVGDISVSFQRDVHDVVSGLVLHQHGDRQAPRLSAAEAAKDNKAVRLDEGTLHDYVGQYQLGPHAFFDCMVKDGQAYMSLTGQPSFPIYASAKDRFFYTVVEAKLDFERDANGAVAAVILHQNGKDQRARRTAP